MRPSPSNLPSLLFLRLTLHPFPGGLHTLLASCPQASSGQPPYSFPLCSKQVRTQEKAKDGPSLTVWRRASPFVPPGPQFPHLGKGLQDDSALPIGILPASLLISMNLVPIFQMYVMVL